MFDCANIQRRINGSTSIIYAKKFHYLDIKKKKKKKKDLNYHFKLVATKIMPRPKYYCDYCDKTFFDVGDARRNHFESKQHKMLVKLYYDSLKGIKHQKKKKKGKNRLLT